MSHLENLADDELAARLVHRDVPPATAVDLAAGRDRPHIAVLIDQLLGEDG